MFINIWIKSYQPKINAFDIVILLRQLAVLIAAGIPIVQSCDILEKSREKTSLRLLVYHIKKEIMNGKNLFHSLQQQPDYFDEFTCQLIRIGEYTGKLDQTLFQIAARKESQLALKKQINHALFYPCIIVCTAIVITLAMFLFVIPKFNELFQDTTEQLPLLTHCLFYFSASLEQHIKAICVVIVVVIAIVIYFHDKPVIKNNLQSLAANIPFLKPCLHKMILANFARNLALTFAAGITITEGLRLSTNTRIQTEFNHIISKLHHQINAGIPLHRSMAAFSYFPTLMIQMVKIGEESGKLETMLIKTAEFLEADFDYFISHFSKMLEPLIMILLGVLIGGLTIAMYLPLFKLGSAF